MSKDHGENRGYSSEVTYSKDHTSRHSTMTVQSEAYSRTAAGQPGLHQNRMASWHHTTLDECSRQKTAQASLRQDGYLK